MTSMLNHWRQQANQIWNRRVEQTLNVDTFSFKWERNPGFSHCVFLNNSAVFTDTWETSSESHEFHSWFWSSSRDRSKPGVSQVNWATQLNMQWCVTGNSSTNSAERALHAWHSGIIISTHCGIKAFWHSCTCVVSVIDRSKSIFPYVITPPPTTTILLTSSASSYALDL